MPWFIARVDSDQLEGGRANSVGLSLTCLLRHPPTPCITTHCLLLLLLSFCLPLQVESIAPVSCHMVPGNRIPAFYYLSPSLWCQCSCGCRSSLEVRGTFNGGCCGRTLLPAGPRIDSIRQGALHLRAL